MMRGKKDTNLKLDFTNRVFQTLQLMEASKRKRLYKFLQSPYFVQSDTLFKLGSELIALADKGKTGFNRPTLWAKIWKDEPYNDVLFRKTCSDLLKQIQVFMAHESLVDQPLKRAVESVEFISSNKIETLYKPSLEEAELLFDQIPYKTASDFVLAYRLERQKYSMLDFAVQVDNNRANLEPISQHLDSLFIAEKLKVAGVAISQKRTRNETYRILFLKEVLDQVNGQDLSNNPSLSVNYHAYLTLFDDDNLEHYFKLRSLLRQYGSLIPKSEALEIYDSALHYCTGKMNKGVIEFYQEFFDLFDEGLKKGIFFVNGKLATWRFNNMVAAGLRLDKLDWTEHFIKTYYSYLPQESQQNSLTFNLARVYRFQGKYKEVLTLLQNVEYEDIGHNLISKMMLMITYFELQEFDALQSTLNSFNIFLRRHRNIPAQRRTGYLNLIKYTRKLFRLDFSNRKAVDKLRSEISSNKTAIINHEWLLEKLG